MPLAEFLTHALRRRSVAGQPWHRQRPLRVVAALLFGYALLGFLVVPALVRHYLPGSLRESLGLEASLGDLRLNPFSFRLEADDFRLAESNGAPLAAFRRLVVDFELSSLFRWAWTFADISLEQPEFDLVLEKDGRLNVARILAALPPDSDPDPALENPEAAPPRLFLHRLGVSGARIGFTDQRHTTPASTTLGPLELQFTRITTLREQRGPGTLDAGLPGGAKLAWAGEFALHPLASAGTVTLSGLKPAAFWDFAQPHLALAPPGGVLDASFAYDFASAKGTTTLRTDAMRLDLRDLLLQKPGATAPMLALQRVAVDGGRFDLAGNQLTLGRVSLQGGRVAAALDPRGVLDWESVLAPTPPDAPATAPDAAWRAVVDTVSVENVAVDVYDETRNAPLGLALLARRVGFALTAASGKDGPAIALSRGGVELGDIVLSTGPERSPLGSIARLAVEDAAVDLAAQRLQAAKLSIADLRTAIHRQPDGQLREIVLASVPDPVTPLPLSHAVAQWSAALGEFALSGLDASVADTSTTPALEYGVKGGSLTLKGIDTASTAPLHLDAVLPVVQGGEVRLQGTANADGSAADIGLRLSNVALMPLAPLVAVDTTLKLESGTLSADASIALRSPPGTDMSLQVSGSAGVDELLLLEAASGARFLSWNSLAASGITFSSIPEHLNITELRLSGANAKVVVQKDRSVNLAAVMREPVAATATTERVATVAPAPAVEVVPVPVAAAPVSAAASAAEPFPLSIDRIRVEDSLVDFADYSLVLPFVARIEGLKGVAKGISAAADSRATLSFSGRVGEYGEADIDGQLAPFDPTHYTDIEIAFRNIALTPLSPYSATFAGRTIKAGDLDLSLQYKIDNQKLLGKNEVVLQNFRLGESVKSADAVNLPLDLAIALLSDSKGRIDLAVPVSGDVGDPKFSYGSVIWKAIGNLITGVVTAPFRALGSLFGGGQDEQVQALRFGSGSAELMPMERQRIAKLATALAARPKLGVRVPAATHPGRDGYALRRLQLRREHAVEMGYELAAGEDPGPVSYSNGKSQRVLEKLLAAREGESANDTFAAGWTKTQGRAPERVNAALALVGRGSPDHDYYRELYLYLVQRTPEPPGQMTALARARAEAVSAEFRARGVEAARVSIGKAVPMQKATPAGVMLPLELVAAG